MASLKREQSEMGHSHTERSIQEVHHNYNDAFEMTGYGCMNRWVLVACSLIFVHAAQEMTGIAYVITMAQCELNLSVSEVAMVTSGVFIGIVSTAIIWGNICDRIGRRKIIVPTLTGAIISSFASSLSTVFWTMMIFRILTGVLVSATSATVLVYLGELHVKRYRDIALAIAVGSDQLNFVFFPGYAWAIIPRNWSFDLFGTLIRPWRVFMWTWAITGIAGGTILFFLPESPRFVLASYGNEDALEILAKIYAKNMNKRPQDYPVRSLRATVSVMSMGKSSLKAIILSMGSLVKPPLRRCYILTHYCMLMTMLFANGLYIWMPDILNEVMRDTTSTSNICSIIYEKYVDVSKILKTSDDGDGCSGNLVEESIYPVSMAMELVYFVPYAAVIVLINKVSRIKLYVVIMCSCSLSLILCFIIPQIVGATVAIAVALSTGGCASVLTALAIDAFPTKLRALSMCTMYMAGQFGTVIGITLISLMKGMFCEPLFVLVSASGLFSAFVLYKYWPDLAEVQKEMERHNYSY